jgi:hypothetical protein
MKLWVWMAIYTTLPGIESIDTLLTAWASSSLWIKEGRLCETRFHLEGKGLAMILEER